MKKKTKNKLMIFGVLALLLIVGGFIAIQPFATYMPLSITKYDYFQDGEFGTTFRVLISTIKGGEKIISSVNVDNTDFSGSGQIPEKDFTIDIENSNQIEFEIQNNYDQIYKYDVAVSDKYFCISANSEHAKEFSKDYCEGKDYCTYYARRHPKFPSTVCRDFVLFKTSMGTIGDIENNNIRSITDVCIQPTSSAEECVTIDNLGSTVGRTSNMLVKYVGNTVTGYGVDKIRSTSNRIMQPVYTGNWHMVEEQTVTDYKINEQIIMSDFSNMVNIIVLDNYAWDYPYKYFWDGAIDNFRKNDNHIQILTGSTSISIANSNLKSFVFENKYSETGTMLKAVPTQDVIETQLIIDIDADWIGIERFSGIPKIISEESERWQSGVGSGHVYVTVKNIGNNEGTFLTTMNCEGIFESTNSQTEDLRASQTKEFDLRFRTSGSCAESPSGYCDIKVEDIISGKYDTKRAQVSCVGTTMCQEGTKKCSPESNAVQECNEFGTGYETIKECPSGTSCKYSENGQPYCSDGVEPKTCSDLCEINYEWYNPELYGCKIKCSVTNFFVSNVWFFVGFFVIAIGGIGVYLYLKYKK